MQRGRSERTFLAHWHVTTVATVKIWMEIGEMFVGAGSTDRQFATQEQLEMDGAECREVIEVSCRQIRIEVVSRCESIKKRGDSCPDSKARDGQESEGRGRLGVQQKSSEWREVKVQEVEE